MDNVTESILREYPYPIAKCYEKLVRTRDVSDRRDQARYLFEATLKYCACVAIAQYLRAGHPDPQTNTALSCLNKPSLGHWLNLFRQCVRHNQTMGASLFGAEVFDKTKNRPAMAEGLNAIKEFIDPGKRSEQEALSVLAFMEAMVSYRNKSAGHGAPQRDHVEKFAPILERALVDCLLHMDVLKRAPLVYLSEIRVERRSFVHNLIRLMGTTQIAISDYVTSREDALLGLDKNLFVCVQDTDTPAFSLHPLLIYASDEVFLLQHSDLKHNVDYLCHHTGAAYSADRIYEDFKERLGAFFSDEVESDQGNVEHVYHASARMSLVDGVIADEERAYLDEMRASLGISEGRAQEIETSVQRELNITDSESVLKTSPPSREPGQIRRQSEPTPLVRAYPRILFFPYASVRLAFWADLVSRIAAEAHKKNMVFSMVVPDPISDYDPATMTALVAELDRIIEMHAPDLIVMVPPPSRPFMDLFQKWFLKCHVPLMTIDTEFFNYDVFRNAGSRVPPIVQVDNVEGGRIAAQMLMERTPPDVQKPHYLVMPGLDDAHHSHARVRGFEQAVKSVFPESRIRLLRAGEFQRQKARKAFEDFLEDANLSRYHGIFCCNDEMALGIYACLCTSSTAAVTASPFKVVGFNNTAEMRSAILVDRTGFLAGTVDQNMVLYTETILTVIGKLLKGEAVEERYLIKPVAVPAASVSEM